MSVALRFAARSDVGLLREGNEDSVYAGPRVLAVADGMGGHAAGEVASAIAIAAIAPLDEDAPGPDLLDALRNAATSANDHLRDMMAGDPALDGMGTTLTSLLFASGRLGLLHIGDSRCYLLRDGELSQITRDHTLVQTLVDDGRISEEEASSHPQRSLITRALDGRDSVEPDLSVREARPGDRYLLCTDGLTGPVGRRETLQEALTLPDPQTACDRLVELALRGGGPDNITVIVADVVDGGQVLSAPPVVAGAAAEDFQSPPPGAAESAAVRARSTDGREPERPLPAAATTGAAESAGRRRRRTGRVVLVAALTVLLLGTLTAAGWAYVRSQYYVGTDGGAVTVYRGVTGTVGGLSLASVEQRTDLSVTRLDDVAMSRLTHGIVARDRQEADAIVQRLAAAAMPMCPTPTPTPATPTGLPPTASAASPGTTPAAPDGGTGPTAAASPVPSAGSAPPAAAGIAPSPAAPGTAPSPAAPGTPAPGTTPSASAFGTAATPGPSSAPRPAATPCAPAGTTP